MVGRSRTRIVLALTVTVLAVGSYLLSHWKAFAYSADFSSHAYQETSVPCEIRRELVRDEFSPDLGVEFCILLPRRYYSRESLIRILKWCAQKHPDKWVMVTVFTDPVSVERYQPERLDPLPGFLLPKGGWDLFREKFNTDYDALMKANDFKQIPAGAGGTYRPVLWLPFYWRNLEGNNLRDLH